MKTSLASIFCLFILFNFSLGLRSIIRAPNENHSEDTSSKFKLYLITNGSYYLKINNKTWLSSSPKTFLRANGIRYDTLSYTLVLNQTTASSGYDVLGRWQSLTYRYNLYNDPNTIFDCSIITYDDYDLVRFKQNFPNGVKRTSLPDNYDSVISSFPSFSVKTPDELDVSYLSFGGMMAGDMEKLYGKWNSLTSHINDGIAGGPLVLFNPTGDTLVISQMSEFMSTSLNHDRYVGGALNYGIMSGVDQVPKNYSADFIVYYSDKGINKAMQGWGDVLLKYYNKNLKIRDEDPMVKYLAYWMDNGAYYYWLTEKGKTYQDTVLDIVDDFQKNKIPFKSLQYDSWWYGAQRGYRQGCFRWNGNIPSDRFPQSLEYVYKKYGLPITAHNKFWDFNVTYARDNGGSYNFILDDFTRKSLPDDQSFWDDLFRNGTKWGLKTYEQDWLNHQTLDFTPLMTSISLGKRWLTQMGQAATKNNITLQYCMSLSRHVLQSLEIDSVTQVRVTNDYATNWQYGGEQWRLGVSSILSASIGLAPFKDVYWTTSVQPGNPYGSKVIDPYVELNSVVSILTAGPVGPGDRIGEYMNRTLIMRSCNDDGLLLKPSRPVTAIDDQIYAKVFGSAYGPIGEVWSTYSKINNYTFGIILAVDIKNLHFLSPLNVGFDVNNASFYWRDGSDSLNQFTDGLKVNSIPIDRNCTMLKFCLYYVTPTFDIKGNQVVILGERSKWVPMSQQRVTNIQQTSNSLNLEIIGAPNETVTFTFSINSKLTKIDCIFNQASTNRMTIQIDFTSGLKQTCNK